MLFWRKQRQNKEEVYALEEEQSHKAAFNSNYEVSVDKENTISSDNPVTIQPNGDVRINVSSAIEAKIAIKQLKLYKKQLSIDKKTASAQISQLKAQYRMSSAQKGSMMRGGGGVGKFVRIVQRAERDSARLNKERAIAPYEQEKLRLDTLMNKIDSAIITLQQYEADNRS